MTVSGPLDAPYQQILKEVQVPQVPAVQSSEEIIVLTPEQQKVQAAINLGAKEEAVNGAIGAVGITKIKYDDNRI